MALDLMFPAVSEVSGCLLGLLCWEEYRGVARNFPTGAESSGKGAELRLKGCYNWKISEKIAIPFLAGAIVP